MSGQSHINFLNGNPHFDHWWTCSWSRKFFKVL